MSAKMGIWIGILGVGLSLAFGGKQLIKEYELEDTLESVGIVVMEDSSVNALPDVDDWDVSEVTSDVSQWFDEDLPEVDVSEWDVTEITDRTVAEIQRIEQARQDWLNRDQ